MTAWIIFGLVVSYLAGTCLGIGICMTRVGRRLLIDRETSAP